VFKQQSQSAKAANFTVGLASGDPASGFALDLVDYSVAANQVETQVIVFDWSTSNATLNYEKRTFSLNDAVYAAVADQIARKIADFQQSYLKLIHISPTA
jgi:hypothetical protein